MIKKPFLATLMVAVVLATIPMAGCNAYNDAVNAQQVVGQIIGIAQSDLPVLAAQGLFSQVEAQDVAGFLTTAATLNTANGTCIAQAHAAGNKKSAFLQCWNTFETAFVQNLSGLHIVSSGAVAKVQLWATAITLAVNGILQILGAQPAAMPALSATPATRADLDNLSARVGLRILEGERYGTTK